LVEYRQKNKGKKVLKKKEEFFDINLGPSSPSNYKEMFDFLEKIGYNPLEDIHKQFVEKWNKVSKKPISYKRRNKFNKNLYLITGERNPEYQRK
jgi:hypothetical protein